MFAFGTTIRIFKKVTALELLIFLYNYSFAFGFFKKIFASIYKKKLANIEMLFTTHAKKMKRL